MGIDYFNCPECDEIYPDCGGFITCVKCESWICESCADEVYREYGRVDPDSEDADYFGDFASLGCSECSGDKEKLKIEVVNLLTELSQGCSEVMKEKINIFLDKAKGVW